MTLLEKMLSDLNDGQREAVTAFDRPLLVLSGAGTGKTKVLSTKFYYATAERGISPDRIMAVTFTKKAAAELKTRIKPLISFEYDPENLWIGTFHSLSARILRHHPSLHQIGENFTIIQPDEARRIMTTLVRRSGAEADLDRRANEILGSLERLKNEGVDLLAPRPTWPRSAGYVMDEDYQLMMEFQKTLLTMQAADYGDLLCGALRIMRQYPAVKAAWSSKFKLVMVDEYQDTNEAQREWVSQLAGAASTLCCLGDDDQSVYKWRGARVENLLNFDSDWPNARTIHLNVNYRCPPEILEKATNLISTNKARVPKNVTANKQIQGRIQSIPIKSFNAMTAEIDRIIANRGNRPFRDVIILTRTNDQAVRVANALDAKQIPVQIFNPDRYNSQQMINFLCWMRLAANLNDDAAVCTILSSIADRAIIDSIWTSARLLNQRLSDRLETLEELNQITNPNILDFTRKTRELRQLKTLLADEEIIDTIFDISGVARAIATAPELQREHFYRLYASLREKARAGASFATLIERAQTELIEQNESRDAVTISTMHGIKGLEAPIVISPGWDDGAFPRREYRPKPDSAEIDEERKLAFVTITRASEQAYILYDQIKGPSVFLSEMRLSTPSSTTTV